MSKQLLAARLKNSIGKIQPGLEFYLRNILVNGQPRGCSGFVQDTQRGTIAYVDTEKSSYGPLEDKNLYRKASDLQDYSGKGGYNQWVVDEDIALSVVQLLTR